MIETLLRFSKSKKLNSTSVLRNRVIDELDDLRAGHPDPSMEGEHEQTLLGDSEIHSRRHVR